MIECDSWGYLRNGVGDDDLVDHRTLKVFGGAPRHQAVCGHEDDALRLELLEEISRQHCT